MQNSAVFDNNELFDPLGHLTDGGLRALCNGTLDTLGRLEASEHLSFCDLCLARYTALIEKMPQGLQAPMRDLVPQVRALMRRRSFRILTNRYFSAAAAVVLAFVMWRFALLGTAAPLRREFAQPQPAPGQTWHTTLHGWADAIDTWLDGFSFELPTLDTLTGLFGQTKE